MKTGHVPILHIAMNCNELHIAMLFSGVTGKWPRKALDLDLFFIAVGV